PGEIQQWDESSRRLDESKLPQAQFGQDGEPHNRLHPFHLERLLVAHRTGNR
ncbi:hypothetical protein NDU88_004224, partial [Pleurodeles waltl]